MMISHELEPIPANDVLIGLDLGQAHDYSGLVVVERTTNETAPHYLVRSIQRLPLGASYPAQVAHVKQVVASIADRRPKPRIALIADYTGCGRPVADMLQAADLSSSLELVSITGGDAVTRGASGEYRVPKRDLASSILVLLQAKRLEIAGELPLSTELKRELTGFRVKISLTGHDSYGAGEDWRSAPHDDLVLALALACWYGETMGSGWADMDAGFVEWMQEIGVA